MRLSSALATACVLAACGGGYSSPSMPSSPASQTPAATSTAQPPAPGAGAITLADANSTIAVSGGDYVVKSPAAADVNVSGNTNTVTFAANQVAGIVAVSGNGNIIVFASGTTVSSLTITGINNTVWIPIGSKIAIAGSGSLYNVTNMYTPM